MGKMVSDQFKQAEASSQASHYLRVENECVVCGWCGYSCPVVGCITFETGIADINPETCIECGRCIFVCPVSVIIPLREARPRPVHERKK